MVILGREPLANGLDVTRHDAIANIDAIRSCDDDPCQGLLDMSWELIF